MPITTTQLNLFRNDIITAASINDIGLQNAIVNYYTYLDNNGIAYGAVARGVANESDPYGKFAMDVLRTKRQGEHA